MHDPLHVVFTVRRPLSALRDGRRKHGRGFLIWAFRAKTWSGSDGEETRVPLRRRAFLAAYMLRGAKREWPLPALFTVWHRDPERDGTDSSCRNSIRARRQEAIKDRRFLRAAALDWWWRHYDLFHVHHWTIQFDLAQRWRRRLFTRCATCGGREERGRPINFHVVVDRDAESRRREKRSFRERWLTGEPNLHHHACADLASVRATKDSLGGWLEAWGKDGSAMRMMRDREPYYGCYPWWREAILGESPEDAAAKAAAHVQRSCHPCPDCHGTGDRLCGESPNNLRFEVCPRCDGAGHERVENPIPAEMV